MKVLAINSSPMMGKGNTARILDPFLEGMREAGAEVDLVYTKKLDINPCHGEFNCWAKRPRGARTPIGNSQGHCCGPLARH